MNQLPLTGLIALALRLPAIQKVSRRLYGNTLGIRSHELDLKRLGYLDSDGEWYYLAPEFNRIQHSLRHLLDSGRIPCCDGWRNWTEPPVACIEQVASHPIFQDLVLVELRRQYVSLPGSAQLIGWIRSTKQAAPAMTEIIRAGLSADTPESVRQILFRPRASTADGLLRTRKDVCFSCPPALRCYTLRDHISELELLSQYRYTELEALLQTLHSDLTWSESVTTDWLITKFFLPHTISVRAKRFMIDIGIIAQDTAVLDKSHGQYCPKRDHWPLVTSQR
jgi:hypothetical protein